jgi:hypothetical protein
MEDGNKDGSRDERDVKTHALNGNNCNGDEGNASAREGWRRRRHPARSLCTRTLHAHSARSHCHAHSARSRCTLKLHAHSARSLCTPTLHAHSARSLCTLTLHAHSARSRSLCTLTLHAHSARSLCTLTLHAHSARSLCTLILPPLLHMRLPPTQQDCVHAPIFVGNEPVVALAGVAMGKPRFKGALVGCIR